MAVLSEVVHSLRRLPSAARGRSHRSALYVTAKSTVVVSCTEVFELSVPVTVMM